ncbi:MAG: transposase [Phycisphaerales bacterium JB063]
MPRPIVIAHHLIWTTYGSWLPNDPRGSGSHDVRRVDLQPLGESHLGRKRIQPAGPEIRAFYEQAIPQLQHNVYTFNATETECVANAFAEVVLRERYTCYACAVMPDHVHLLIRKHKHTAETMIDNLKQQSRLRLSAAFPKYHHHPTWTAGHGWQVFLEHPDDIERTIRYVEKNPDGMRLPRQHWPFVTAYDRWPLHPGHSPNSPYAKRLEAAGRYP